MWSSNYIITKNIVVKDLEKLVRDEVLNYRLLINDEFVEIKIKNSRLSVIILPEEIGNLEQLILFVNKLISYKDNNISHPEVVFVYQNKVLKSSAKDLNINTEHSAVIQNYKLLAGPLHTILKIAAQDKKTKNWWQFWK